MNLFGGCCENNIERHHIHERFADFKKENAVDIKGNKMKIFFILDRFIYTNEKNEIEFDTEFYERTYDLTYPNDLDNPYEFFLQYSMRLMSIHTFRMGEVLPFTVIGIWENNFVKYPFKSDFRNDFLLIDLRANWECLMNDVQILEHKIKRDSFLEKSLIWHIFGKLSQTKLERFLNFYRVFETLSTELYRKEEDEMNYFINNKLNMFNKKNIQRTFRIPEGEKVKSFLKSQCVEIQTIDKIINFRHKIAHGEDYALEFNRNLSDTNEEMDDVISIIINRRIKTWGIKNLKNQSLIRGYNILICKYERKIILIDSDDYDCYRKENGKGKGNRWDMTIGIGRQTNDDELENDIYNMLNCDRIGDEKFERQLCKNLVNNYGEIINY